MPNSTRLEDVAQLGTLLTHEDDHEIMQAAVARGHAILCVTTSSSSTTRLRVFSKVAQSWMTAVEIPVDPMSPHTDCCEIYTSGCLIFVVSYRTERTIVRAANEDFTHLEVIKTTTLDPDATVLAMTFDSASMKLVTVTSSDNGTRLLRSWSLRALDSPPVIQILGVDVDVDSVFLRASEVCLCSHTCSSSRGTIYRHDRVSLQRLGTMRFATDLDPENTPSLFSNAMCFAASSDHVRILRSRDGTVQFYDLDLKKGTCCWEGAWSTSSDSIRNISMSEDGSTITAIGTDFVRCSEHTRDYYVAQRLLLGFTRAPSLLEASLAKTAAIVPQSLRESAARERVGIEGFLRLVYRSSGTP